MTRTLILAIIALALSTSVRAQQRLTLDQVRQLALSHNISTRSADNAIRQAEEQKKEAFTNYFPQVSASGIGFKSSTEMLKADISTAGLMSSSLASVIPSSIAASIPGSIPVGLIDRGVVTGVTAVQPIFMGGQIINGNKLARVNLEATRLQKLTSENSVTLTAEQYYWQIVSLKEKMKTLDAVSEMLKKLEKDADIAMKAGVGMRNDLLAVQLKLNDVESNKLKLENGLKLSQMVLAQYIGKEGEPIDVVADAIPDSLPVFPMIKVDHDGAVVSTPEYQLSEKNVEAATLQRKMEMGKNLPSLGIGAGYNYVNWGSGMDNHFGMVFATVSVPLSKWWGGSYAVKRRKLAEQNAREQLADNAQLLKIRMQKNWNDVDDAYKQLALAQKGIEQSEENLRLNRDYYHAGTVTMNDLLDAQQQYRQCRDTYTDAYARLQTKITEYRQSIGEQ